MTPKLVFKATLQLLAESVARALDALKKHPFMPLVGIFYLAVIFIVEIILSSTLGMIGSLLGSIIDVLLMANFLAFILSLIRYKKFTFRDVWESSLSIISPLLGTFFVFFILQIVLSAVISGPNKLFVSGMFNLVLFVLFNPLPEIVSRREVGGIGALHEALEFMKENGPEWLGSLLLVFGPFLLLFSPKWMLWVVSSVDPLSGVFVFFKFGMLTLLPNAFSFHFSSVFFVILGFYYMFFVFLFRMVLFEKLSTSSRRKRIYNLGVS